MLAYILSQWAILGDEARSIIIMCFMFQVIVWVVISKRMHKIESSKRKKLVIDYKKMLQGLKDRGHDVD